MELLPGESKRVRALAKADEAVFMQMSGLVFINRARFHHITKTTEVTVLI